MDNVFFDPNHRLNIRYTSNGLYVASFILLMSLLYFLFYNAFEIQKAFADGLTQENLPPATLGNRQASLFVKINPPILITATRQDAYMQFRLFDANTNQTIKFTTFYIQVTKGTSTNSQ